MPERASWLKDLEDELFNWQGEPNEVNDQIDVLSSAGSEAASRGLGEQVDDTLPIPTHMSMPRAVGSFQSPYL